MLHPSARPRGGLDRKASRPPSLPQTRGQGNASLPGTCSQGGSEDTGLETPVAGLRPTGKERTLQGEGLWKEVPRTLQRCPRPNTIDSEKVESDSNLTALPNGTENILSIFRELSSYKVGRITTYFRGLRLGLNFTGKELSLGGLQESCSSVAAAAL